MWEEDSRAVLRSREPLSELGKGCAPISAAKDTGKWAVLAGAGGG